MRHDSTLDKHLEQRERDLDRDLQIAVHRNANDKHEISKQINSVAVKVGQLCSIDGDYAQVEIPFTKLITSYSCEEVFKCDLLSRNFEKIKVPGFTF